MLTDLVTAAPSVRRRLADDTDTDLRRELFLAARPEFAAIPAEVRELLVELQLKAQRWQQSADHANVRHEVLVSADSTDGDIGMISIAEGADTIHLVDIAVLPAHRNRGLGSLVLGQLIDAAGERDVRLFVWADNTAARRLYERLGFGYDDEGSTDEGHLAMTRPGTRL